MRCPFYRASRDAWYVTAKMRNKKLKQVFLSRDKGEAFALFDEHYNDRQHVAHKPVGTREVIVTKTVTESITRTLPSSSESDIDDDREPLDGVSLGRRYGQLERRMLLVKLLSPLRRGATSRELRNDVRVLLCVSIHPKTISRDLLFLSEAGIVDTDDGRRFRWIGANLRSVLLERMSERFADRHE